MLTRHIWGAILVLTAVERRGGNKRGKEREGVPVCHSWPRAHLFIAAAAKEKTNQICLQHTDKILPYPQLQPQYRR